jgi:hypothetical protein
MYVLAFHPGIAGNSLPKIILFNTCLQMDEGHHERSVCDLRISLPRYPEYQ